MDDDAIRTLVTRLSRVDSSGGGTIERAAILAEGSDLGAVVAWITAHGGTPEVLAPTASGRGLHSADIPGGAPSTNGLEPTVGMTGADPCLLDPSADRCPQPGGDRGAVALRAAGR